MTSVAILLILLPTGLALGYHRYMGTRATRHVSIEVACLSLDQIVDIGTKSSTSMVKRVVRRPQPWMQGSQDLLRRRRRTLEAIARAGLPVPPPAFVMPETAETVRA